MVSKNLVPELRLVDHAGQPFDLREALTRRPVTALYTFRGHW